MSAFEVYKKYTGTLSFRREGMSEVRPECEPWDGLNVLLEAVWQIDEEDRKDYAGEFAFLVLHPTGWPAGWVASGDIKDIQPFEGEHA